LYYDTNRDTCITDTSQHSFCPRPEVIKYNSNTTNLDSNIIRNVFLPLCYKQQA